MGAVGVEPGVRLIGRATELDRLSSVVDGAAAGGLRFALVTGEAGIGKSRLVAEALTDALGRGFQVLSGSCDEIEQERPLRALAEALDVERSVSDPRRADFARLLRTGTGTGPVVHEPGSVDVGWVIVEGVLDVMEELASTAPIALAVEDLQWADPLTLRALHAIARHLTRVPLGVLVTVRSGHHLHRVDLAVADLLARGATHVALGPLGVVEAADLTSAVLGHPAGPRLLEQVADAAGNPLFVIELLRALDDDGAMVVKDGRVESRSSSMPPTLRLTLLRRLSLLPDEAVDLLRAASILGSTFSLSELSVLIGLPSAQLAPAVTAAVGAGLLVDAGERLAFRHELVRAAIYHDQPAAVRKALHRDAATALERAGVSVDRVAGHVVLGAEPGDAEAVTWLRHTGGTVAGRSPATAVRLLERALELADPADPVRDAIRAELVEPLLSTGRLRDAEEAARDVLARGVAPEVELMARTGLASVLSMGARYPEGIEQLELASLAASDQRPALIGARSVMMVLGGQTEPARATAGRAIELAVQAGDDHGRCLGLQCLAMVALTDGLIEPAITFAAQASRIAERGDSSWAARVVPHLWLGTALADGDRLSEAHVAFHQGRSRAEQVGDVTRLPLFHWGIAEARLAGGEWDDALAEAEAGLGLVEENAPHVGDVFALAIRAHVALHRGDPMSARSAVREAGQRLVAGPVEIGFEWMTWIDALLLEANGRSAEALAALEQMWDSIAPVRYLQASSRTIGPDLVRMAVRAGDRHRAMEVTEELERSAERSPTPTTRGLALRCRGLLSGDLDALLQSVDAHRTGPRPYQLAAACEDAGAALLRVSRPDEAASLLDEAVAGYGVLDAAWDIARVRSMQRDRGVPRSRRTRRRPSFGWASLTPTEHRVLALVAQGMTNREVGERLYVSRRTVATHVEHLLQKLGHTNRVELAAEAILHAVTDPETPAAPTAPEADQASRRTRAPASRRS